jgi:hypothetical protein
LILINDLFVTVPEKQSDDLPRIRVNKFFGDCEPEYIEVWVKGFPNHQALNLLLQSIASPGNKLLGDLQGLTLPFAIEDMTEISVVNLTIDYAPESVVEVSFTLRCPYAKH